MIQYKLHQAKDFFRDVVEAVGNLIKKPYPIIPTLTFIFTACSPKNTPTVRVDSTATQVAQVQYDPTLEATLEQLTYTATVEPTYTATVEPTYTATVEPTETPTSTPITLESALLTFNYGGLGRSIWGLPDNYEPGKKYFLKTGVENFPCNLVVYDGGGSTSLLPPIPGDDQEANAILCTADYYSTLVTWVLELFEGEVDKDGTIIKGGQEQDKVGEYEFVISAEPGSPSNGEGGGSGEGGTTPTPGGGPGAGGTSGSDGQ